MMSYGMHIRYLSEDQAPLEHAVVTLVENADLVLTLGMPSEHPTDQLQL